MFFQDDKSVAAAKRRGRENLPGAGRFSRISPAPLLFWARSACFPQEHEIPAGSVNPVLCKTPVTLANPPLLRAPALLNMHADGM